VSGYGQVELRIGAQVLVDLKRQLEAGEAVRVSALTQERDGEAPAKLASLLGDPLVGAAEDVFRLHDVHPHVPVGRERLPRSPGPNLARSHAAADNRPVGAREKRLAANEALFREVNERVAEVAEQFITGESRVNFSCECGDRACGEQIAMTVGDYEALRSEATHFAVVPGHEVPDIERVVARHPNYFVVEKQDPDAEEVARETDPRT
jgi:hypothetical protein